MSDISAHDSPINAPLPPGTVLQQGSFVVGEVLGRGGFGITYRAQNRANGANAGGSGAGFDSAAIESETVAIKEFFPDGCARGGRDVQLTNSPRDAATAVEEESARQNFLNEARVLAALHHPGIVRVYAAFQENNTAYMVMEFLDGATLQEIVLRRGPLPESEALNYIEKIGAALGEVHRANFIHRDIKAENIIVGADNRNPAPPDSSFSNLLKRAGSRDAPGAARVTLLDFGLNKEIGGAGTYHTLRLTNALRFGSPGYSPPEQYGRQARFGPYTDIYALGALLYYLLSGQIPPEAPERMGGDEVIPLHQLRPQISRAVSDAVTWALQLKGDERPQTITQFLNALRPDAAVPVHAVISTPSPVVHIVSSPIRTTPTALPATHSPSSAVAAPSPQQSPATAQRATASLKNWPAALSGRFWSFIAQGLKRVVGSLWTEVANILPRLLFLAFVIALGIIIARHQQHRRQQQWLYQHLQTKQHPAKDGRVIKKRGINGDKVRKRK